MRTRTNNPIEAARELHSSIGWSNPNDYTLEEVANAIGIMIRKEHIEGSDGRILIDGNSAILTVDSEITYAPKKNFIIAHEIGHFLLHKSITPLFSETYQTLSEWHKNGPHEKQANQFAAEFLMPENLFKEKLAKRKLNITLIQEMSNYFKTSLTATFLRYTSQGDFPLMIVFIENGHVKWKSCSIDFPFPFITVDSEVPPLTVAGDYFYKSQYENEPEKVDAIEWFPDNFNLQRNPDLELWEQCYPVSPNGFISCLWMP